MHRHICRQCVWRSVSLQTRWNSTISTSGEGEDLFSLMYPHLAKILHDVDISLEENQQSTFKDPQKQIFHDLSQLRNGSNAYQLARKGTRLHIFPEPLVKSTRILINEIEDKKVIRHAALKIFERLRRSNGPLIENKIETTKFKRKNQVDIIKQDNSVTKEIMISKKVKLNDNHFNTYDFMESLAYIATIMPTNYAIIYNVFEEISRRLPMYQPKSIIDFGTGPGTALWAAKYHPTWTFETYIGVDPSASMLAHAVSLVTLHKEQLHKEQEEFKEDQEFKYQEEFDNEQELSKFNSEKASNNGKAFAFQPEWRSFLPDDFNLEADVIISAFTFSEMKDKREKHRVLRSLWAGTKDLLIIIDRGTPNGFKEILDIREFIINFSTEKEEEMHILAPCPHHFACPLRNTRDWCHFSQSIQRPDYLMDTKHSSQNKEDGKFSYIVFKKGKKPMKSDTEEVSEIDLKNEKDTNKLAIEAYSWPRLIYPPLQKNRHKHMDVCASNGFIERHTFPKSLGQVIYRDVKMARWGDLFPHKPKTIIQRDTTKIGVINRREKREKKETKIKDRKGNEEKKRRHEVRRDERNERKEDKFEELQREEENLEESTEGELDVVEKRGVNIEIDVVKR